MNHGYPFAVAALVAVLVAGCATKEPPVAAKPAPAPAPAPEAAKPAPAPAAPTETYSRLAGRKIKPIAVKPITVKADCSYRDPTGYGGKLKLAVDQSQVHTLQAEIQVPKRGNCAFALRDFHQTAKEPSVTLAANSGVCTVRVWEQEGKVTVAFNSCKDRCKGDSFDYVWPILVDAKTGKCS
jgi:pyruvate/2-oxoglutarate dehydrogenase complex dihydrolipoamide acyltransferase (E2) component